MPTIRYLDAQAKSKRLSGATVGDVRQQLESVLGIPASACPLVGGVQVEEDYQLRSEDRLEFLDVAPQVGQVWNAEEFCELFRMSQADLHDWVARGLPVLRLGDGSIRITETAVDDFFRRRKEEVREATLNAIAKSIERIANHFVPPPSDIVDSPFIASSLGCTTVWVAEMTRDGTIPKSCVVPGTGNGKPWKYYRSRVEDWLRKR